MSRRAEGNLVICELGVTTPYTSSTSTFFSSVFTRSASPLFLSPTVELSASPSFLAVLISPIIPSRAASSIGAVCGRDIVVATGERAAVAAGKGAVEGADIVCRDCS